MKHILVKGPAELSRIKAVINKLNTSLNKLYDNNMLSEFEHKRCKNIWVIDEATNTVKYDDIIHKWLLERIGG